MACPENSRKTRFTTEDKMKLGLQIGVIVYGNGLNVRNAAQDAIARGFVVVWRDGFATIHQK